MDSPIFRGQKEYTPSVPDNLEHFDSARVLRNLMESELKKLVGCGSYF